MRELSSKTRLTGISALVLAGALALTGCAGGEEDDPKDDPKPTSTNAGGNTGGGGLFGGGDPDNTDDNGGETGGTGGNGGGMEPGDDDEFREPEDQSVFDINVGDCLANPDDSSAVQDEVADVKTVPCSQPHAYEVYHDFQIEEPSDGKFPGMDKVIELAEQGCYDEFEAFIGHPYNTSKWDFSFFYPTESSWDGALKDRTVSCMVFDVELEEGENPTTGSVQGIGE